MGDCALCGRAVRGSDTPEGYCCVGCQELDEELASTDGEGEGPNPTSRPEGTVRTFLRVDGMHSATCEAFLETVAKKRAGVEAVEASYVTETVRVDHDPERIGAADLEEALSTLGYTAYRRSNATADESGTSRRSRELHGIRKRRDDTFLDLRYAAGILFGAFLFVPYVALLYPAQLADVLPWGILDTFAATFRLEGAGGLLFLRVYFVMTGIVLFFTGAPVLRGAYVGLRTRRPTPELFVALTAVGAYAYGTVAVLIGQADVYYDLTVVVAAAATGAIFYESAAKRRALDRLTDLTISQVDTARRRAEDGTQEVPVEELEAGDEIVVREGERVPVGGRLQKGKCVFNEAVVTGESLPVNKAPDDRIVAGAILERGAAVVETTERPISGVDRLTATVWDLQSADHAGSRYADRRAARLLPLVLGAAIVAGVGTIALGRPPVDGLLAALLTLVVASPWALGIATPISVATSVLAALERGIVVFDDTVFERLRGVDIVVFDKTGTLTTGEMEVHELDATEDVLTAAVAVERRAAHPVASALVDSVDSNNSLEVSAFESHGTGVSGVVGDEQTLVGTPELFDERGWELDADLRKRADNARKAGDVPVLVGREGAAEGIAVVGDTPRAGWEETVTELAERGVEVIVLTGDRSAAAGFLSEHDAIDRVFAGVPPAAKAEAVRRLGADHRVAMVGDGTNDAMALSVADLGLSLGSGTAMAADAADVAILDDDVRSVGAAFDLARTAGRLLKRNVRLAGVYNVVAGGLVVAGVLAPVFAVGAAALTGGLLTTSSLRAFSD